VAIARALAAHPEAAVADEHHTAALTGREWAGMWWNLSKGLAQQQGVRRAAGGPTTRASSMWLIGWWKWGWGPPTRPSSLDLLPLVAPGTEWPESRMVVFYPQEHNGSRLSNGGNL